MRAAVLRRSLRIAPWFAAALLCTACKTPSVNELPWPSQLGWLKNFLAERDEVTYYPTARENFSKGMDAYIKEDWGDAAKYFDYVRTKFPHSRYAVIAELRLADAHFGKEKWLDAVDAYRAFIRLRPTHDEVPYATFQIAKSYYRQIPEEWFFLPPVQERDQAAARDALRALDDFLIRFPDHERAEEARTLRKEVRSRLAAHEWYVAGYYSGKHNKGAAFRYERIADLYPDVDDAPEGLMRAAQIWESRGDLARAQVDYERVARDYPKSKYAKRAAAKTRELAERAAKAKEKSPASENQPPGSNARPQPAPGQHTPAESRSGAPEDEIEGDDKHDPAGGDEDSSANDVDGDPTHTR